VFSEGHDVISVFANLPSSHTSSVLGAPVGGPRSGRRAAEALMRNLLTLHSDRVLQPPLAPDARAARLLVERAAHICVAHLTQPGSASTPGSKKDMASGVLASSHCSSRCPASKAPAPKTGSSTAQKPLEPTPGRKHSIASTADAQGPRGAV